MPRKSMRLKKATEVVHGRGHEVARKAVGNEGVQNEFRTGIKGTVVNRWTPARGN
jgi:hypothetical protein